MIRGRPWPAATAAIQFSHSNCARDLNTCDDRTPDKYAVFAVASWLSEADRSGQLERFLQPQADFMAYIRELANQHQIIYTTHSPFMVDSARRDDVRVVEDRVKEGTRITGELAGSSNESLFPLQAALGYSIAQNLFIAKKNILIVCSTGDASGRVCPFSIRI